MLESVGLIGRLDGTLFGYHRKLNHAKQRSWRQQPRNYLNKRQVGMKILHTKIFAKLFQALHLFATAIGAISVSHTANGQDVGKLR